MVVRFTNTYFINRSNWDFLPSLFKLSNATWHTDIAKEYSHPLTCWTFSWQINFETTASDQFSATCRHYMVSNQLSSCLSKGWSQVWSRKQNGNLNGSNFSLDLSLGFCNLFKYIYAYNIRWTLGIPMSSHLICSSKATILLIKRVEFANDVRTGSSHADSQCNF